MYFQYLFPVLSQLTLVIDNFSALLALGLSLFFISSFIKCRQRRLTCLMETFKCTSFFISFETSKSHTHSLKPSSRAYYVSPSHSLFISYCLSLSPHTICFLPAHTTLKTEDRRSGRRNWQRFSATAKQKLRANN